jgi:hypothetical protein
VSAFIAILDALIRAPRKQRALYEVTIKFVGDEEAMGAFVRAVAKVSKAGGVLEVEREAMERIAKLLVRQLSRPPGHTRARRKPSKREGAEQKSKKLPPGREAPPRVRRSPPA